jgi:hypothetical protein
MTDIKCVDAERIGNVLEYPADHPVRRHVDDCPRCHALAQTYRAFLEATPADGVGLAAARARLDACNERAAARAFPVEARAPFRVTSGGGFRAWMRPLPALAAALVVVAAAVVMWPDRDETSRLRVSDGSADVWRLSASPARDGSVTLAWNPIPQADAYEVRIYGPELEELLRLPAADASATVERSALPAELPPGSDLTWRVTSLRGGDETATSPPGSFRLP